MAEERRLESLLTELSAELEWPPTPDLREAVERRTGKRRGPGLAILLLAAALAATLAGGAVVSGYLGLRGASVSRVHSLPSPPANDTGLHPHDLNAQ